MLPGKNIIAPHEIVSIARKCTVLQVHLFCIAYAFIMTADKYILNTHMYTTNVQVLSKRVTQTVASKQ